jgi:hypothetical protein
MGFDMHLHKKFGMMSDRATITITNCLEILIETVH